MGYNYQIKKWSSTSASKFVEGCERLKPGDENNFLAKEIICPIDDDADEAYYGSIMLWRNNNGSYTVGFFFGYYCGDMFLKRTTEVKERDVDKLPTLIDNMHKIYCTNQMLDESIRSAQNGDDQNDEV